MKKRTKQLLSLLLALAMVLALCSCGKTGGASTGGEDEQITLTIGVQGKTNITDWEDNYMTKWVEEKTGYNIEFEFFAGTDADAKTQFVTMTAANEELPDILFHMNFTEAERNQYGSEGYFFDLATYFDDEEAMARFAEKVGYDYWEYVNKNIDPVMLEYMKIEARDMDGHWWGFPYLSDSPKGRPRNQVYINKVWLDKLGLEVPTTFDELVTVLQAFKTQDPNGNGEADELPMVGSSTTYRSDLLTWIINRHVYSDPDHDFNIDENGKLYLPYTTDGYRQGLKDCNYLYEQDLLNSLFFTLKDNNELRALVTPADGVAKCGVWAGHIDAIPEVDNPAVLEYVALPPLEDAYSPVGYPAAYFYSFITSDCEHPEEAFELLLTLASSEGSTIQIRGEENVDWAYGTAWDDPEHNGIYLINNISGEPNKSHWGQYGPMVTWLTDWPITDGKDVNPDHWIKPNAPANGVEEETWSDLRYAISKEHFVLALEAAEERNPDLFYKALAKLTAEETMEVDSVKVIMEGYLAEMRAKFVSGELDIDDDAEWNKFCETWEKMGAEKWTSIIQNAYDRTTTMLEEQGLM